MKSSCCCVTDHCPGYTLRKVHDHLLTEHQSSQLDAHRIELTYNSGESIFKEGSFASSVICIRSGLVKIFKKGAQSSTTLLLKKKGDIIGLQSLYGKGVYHFSSEALSETKACLIDISTFKQLISDNTAFASEMIYYINKDMVEMLERLHSFSTKHIHGRLAGLLIYLNEIIYEANPFFLTLQKTDLAEILGTSKESISRIFKELKSDGIIKESDHLISILDPKRLRMISQTG